MSAVRFADLGDFQPFKHRGSIWVKFPRVVTGVAYIDGNPSEGRRSRAVAVEGNAISHDDEGFTKLDSFDPECLVYQTGGLWMSGVRP